MKKEHESKKRHVILIFAVAALCLAGGLCLYLAKTGKAAEPDRESMQESVEQTQVTVPEIEIPESKESPEETEKPKETEKPQETETGENGARGEESVEAESKEPAGGSTNESGQIYVPGFGYVDPPGVPQGRVRRLYRGLG